MKIAEFVSLPERMKAYRDWVGQPMTQAVMGMARDTMGPSGLPTDQRTGEKALYYAGKIDGADEVIALLTSLEDYLLARVQQAKAARLLPDYSADKALESELGEEGVRLMAELRAKGGMTDE